MKKAIATFLTDTHLRESNLNLNHSIYRQAVTHTKNLGLNRIFHLGDVFDSRQSQTIELLKDGFFDILEYLKTENILLHTIAGNHDRTDYSSIFSFLTTFQYHPAFKLVETFELVTLNTEIDLYLLPFFNDEVYNYYLKEMCDTFDISSCKKQKILGTHIGITGSIMNTGVEFHGKVNDSYLNYYNKILVGHFHDQQQFRNVCYIGSGLQHNFGERQNKGLTVLYDDLSIELIPLEFPKYNTYHIKATDLKKSDLKDLEEEKKTSNVRVFLEGSEEEVKAFNKQDLLKLGIKVEKKVPKVDKKVIEQQVEKYDKSKLDNYFSEFCTQNLLEESQGIFYLNQI